MNTPTHGKSATVYKILPKADWTAALRTGAFPGSSDDARDGFVHLSSASQLPGTAAKFFRGQAGLVLVAFRARDLGGDLKWETSRGGELFPHLFAPLPTAIAVDVYDLALDGDGIPVIPEGLA